MYKLNLKMVLIKNILQILSVKKSICELSEKFRKLIFTEFNTIKILIFYIIAFFW